MFIFDSPIAILSECVNCGCRHQEGRKCPKCKCLDKEDFLEKRRKIAEFGLRNYGGRRTSRM